MRVRLPLFLATLAFAVMLGACSKERPAPTAEHHDSNPDTKEPFGRLSIEEMEAKMADAKGGKLALAIIDNNSKATFEKGHLPGAKWVDHTSVKAEDLPSDRGAMLVFYCSSEL